jgi:glutaredoxin
MTRVFVAFSLLLAMCAPAASLGAAGKTYHDKLARCLAEKKVTMYGAMWCDHCKEQKELFGDSFRYVPYVECTVNGTRKITEECKSLGIRRTPTWIFPNGDRQERVIPLDELASRAGCSFK